MQKTTEEVYKKSTQSQASSIRAGNDLNLTSEGDLTMVGAKIGAGKDINIAADEVNILAGRNTDYSKRKVGQSHV